MWRYTCIGTVAVFESGDVFVNIQLIRMCKVMSYYFILSYRIISYHIISYYILYCIVYYIIILYYIILYYIILYYIILYYIILYYIILYYIILYYIILGCIRQKITSTQPGQTVACRISENPLSAGCESYSVAGIPEWY